MDGFLVYQWAEAQTNYYTWIKRRTTGLRWLSRLIQQLWEIAWDMWRHRQKIMQTPDEAFLRNLHRDVDHEISQFYHRFIPNPPRYLARWFLQPLPAILSETLDFKQQWITMVKTILSHEREAHAP